jgi:hypothetical protein
MFLSFNVNAEQIRARRNRTARHIYTPIAVVTLAARHFVNISPARQLRPMRPLVLAAIVLSIDNAVQ